MESQTTQRPRHYQLANALNEGEYLGGRRWHYDADRQRFFCPATPQCGDWPLTVEEALHVLDTDPPRYAVSYHQLGPLDQRRVLETCAYLRELEPNITQHPGAHWQLLELLARGQAAALEFEHAVLDEMAQLTESQWHLVLEKTRGRPGPVLRSDGGPAQLQGTTLPTLQGGTAGPGV